MDGNPARTVPNIMKILSMVLILFESKYTCLGCSTNQTKKTDTNTDKRSINTDDFRELILHHDLFVDKTFLLDEFIKLEGSRLIPLIIRPKGWGKSINMDMIRRFFEMEVDNTGERLPKDKTINDKLFMGGVLAVNSTATKTLKKLKVSLFVARHLGQFPVILVKLKNTTGNSYETIETKVKSRITECFKDHEYLLNSTRISAKEKLRNYINGDFDTDDLITSVLFLSQRLNEHYGRKVHILIDDYDQPMVNAYLALGHESEEFDKLYKLLVSIYASAMKNNPNLDAGLITGVLQVPLMPTMTTGLSNVDVCTLTRTKFSKSFGITEPEVQELLKQIPNSESVDYKNIKSWYNGYNYNERIYFNARSTIRYLHENGTAGYHDFDEDANGLVDSVLLSDEFQEKLHLLISGKSLNFPNLHSRTEPISWDKMDELEVLFLNGYLSPEVTELGTNAKITIPNKEIKQIYESKVLQWLAKKLSINTSEYVAFASLLPVGQLNQFRALLQEYLSKGANFISRIFYHSLIIGLKSSLVRCYLEWYENEQDVGKIDNLILIPKSNRRKHFAIIIKHQIAKTDDLTKVAKDGLQEIQNGQFESKLKTLTNVQKLITISIAFAGEKSALEYYVDSGTSTGQADT